MLDRYRKTQHNRMLGFEGGFTLIELLIVIVVLGILAAVTVFGLGGLSGQSLTSACHADVKSVSVAQEAFRAQTQGPFAATVPALVPTYLRSAPGNTNKYIITTDATDGKVFVQNLNLNPGATATPVDAENQAKDPAWVDPCLKL
jgi:prepilin-type N-terminal cleavage/methylation domain-containing protein